jgi:tripartite motif-containing protein 2/3
MQLRNITICPICLETYSDPRSLPCVHTYCLNCIEGLIRKKCPGDCVACPVCRNKFSIPDKGADGLPKNFIIGQIMDIGQPATQSSKLVGQVQRLRENGQ